jgi:hypothetical protein
MLADVGCPSGTMLVTIGVLVLNVWPQIGSSLQKGLTGHPADTCVRRVIGSQSFRVLSCSVIETGRDRLFLISGYSG